MEIFTAQRESLAINRNSLALGNTQLTLDSYQSARTEQVFLERPASWRSKTTSYLITPNSLTRTTKKKSSSRD